MIRSIALKFGRAPGMPSQTIPVTPVTVFVGPNNSGKSKVLREIHRFCTNGQPDVTDVIVEGIQFDAIAQDLATERLRQVELPPKSGDTASPDYVIVGKRAARNQVHRQTFLSALVSPNTMQAQFCQWYLAFNTLMLDGRNRIGLINSQAAGDLQLEPQSSLQALFKDDALRAEVRRVIYDAFGLYFVIDPTNLGHLRVRLSQRPPHSPAEERGWDAPAVKFHGDAMLVDDASDGVKAFAGMMTEIVAGDPHVLLIDEPEAFLHPALAFNLGREISVAGSTSHKRVFVSTHSPSFVMGCIQSGAPVNIIRLTYRDGVATARLLPSDDILKLMRNPLLRSAGVMGGLFYEAVVVTESDTDRAFYHEINERLLRQGSADGVANCLFLNAQNKQTVKTIIRPLRELGIPAAAIVDVDVLKDGGSVWTSFLEAGFIPELEREPLALLRSRVKQRFDETGKNMKRDGGITLLSETDQDALTTLFDRLDDVGLFVVRRGELESWLRGLGVAGHGPPWLVEMFERMGEDPEAPGYVRPVDGDVWTFMRSVGTWLRDPRRKGIPVNTQAGATS